MSLCFTIQDRGLNFSSLFNKTVSTCNVFFFKIQANPKPITSRVGLKLAVDYYWLITDSSIGMYDLGMGGEYGEKFNYIATFP